jgi:outer membrane protein assembly factor BamB
MTSTRARVCVVVIIAMILAGVACTDDSGGSAPGTTGAAEHDGSPSGPSSPGAVLSVAKSDDPSFGEWSAGVAADATIDGTTILATKPTAVVVVGSLVVGFDWTTGAERWRVPYVARKASDDVDVLAAGDAALLVIDVATARLIDAATGATRWSVDRRSFPPASRALPIGDRLAILSSTGLVVVDAATGQEAWRWRGPALLSLNAYPPIGAADEGALYVVARVAEVEDAPKELVIDALDPNDGSRLWRSPPLDGVPSSITETSGFVIAHVEPSRLVAFNRDDGSRAWSMTPSPTALEHDVVFYDDGSGVIGWIDGDARAGGVNVFDGSSVWRRDLTTHVRLPLLRCGACGRRDFGPVFTVATPDSWVIFDVATGTELRRTGLTETGIAEAATDGHAMVAASAAEGAIRLYAFDLGGSTGSPAPANPVPTTAARGSLALVADDPRIVFDPEAVMKANPAILSASSSTDEDEDALRQELADEGYPDEVRQHVTAARVQRWTSAPTGRTLDFEMVYEWVLLDKPAAAGALLPEVHDTVGEPDVDERVIDGIPGSVGATWTARQADGQELRVTSVRFTCSNLSVRVEHRTTDLRADADEWVVAMVQQSYDNAKVAANGIC